MAPILQKKRHESAAPPIVKNWNDSNFETLKKIIASNHKFLLTTHKGADGDAIGSVVAMKDILTSLGKDCLITHSEGAPRIMPHLNTQAWMNEAPADISERALIVLDCSNLAQVALDPSAIHQASVSVNFDHHASNYGFLQVNAVKEASSTCEMLTSLARSLEIDLTHQATLALYTGLHTDTGGFNPSFPATTDSVIEMAEGLKEGITNFEKVEEGISYEPNEWQKAAVLARENARDILVSPGLSISQSVISGEDLLALGIPAFEHEATARLMVRGLHKANKGGVTFLVTEMPDGSQSVLLRSASPDVNLGEIAAEYGGGGNKPNARFSTRDFSPSDLAASLRRRIVAEIDLSHSHEIAITPVEQRPSLIPMTYDSAPTLEEVKTQIPRIAALNALSSL